jgi:hypothetical protein
MSESENAEQLRSGINPLIVFLTIAGLIGLGIIGAILIIIIRPDATATFTNTFVLIIGIAISFAGTVGVVAPIARRVKVVEKQTNGTLSKKDAEIKLLQSQVIELGGNPHA